LWRGFSLETKVHKLDLLEAVLERLQELRMTTSYGSPYDDNQDRGYGKLNPDKQLSRQQNSVYPYLTPDQYDLEDMDEPEEDVLIRKKSEPFITNDPYAGSAVDPFYFAAGNTKLSDCFIHPDEVLAEIGVMAQSMNTMPHIYKGRSAGSGGSAVHATTGNYKRTGSKRGYTSPPPPSKIAVQLDSERNPDIEKEPEVKDFEHALEIMRDTRGQRSEEA
jgi:hypothetical protein|tara:strand:- start:261 stop:917 length:657 start_codon:yes stop_codon:yes gene_type:complete